MYCACRNIVRYAGIPVALRGSGVDELARVRANGLSFAVTARPHLFRSRDVTFFDVLPETDSMEPALREQLERPHLRVSCYIMAEGTGVDQALG